MKSLAKAFCLVVLISLVGAGCATNKGEAWLRYQEFSAELDAKGRNTDYESYLSSRLMQLIKEAPSEVIDEYFESAEYPRWLKEVHSHYEKVLPNGVVCLTINGIVDNEDSDIGAGLISFTVERGKLVADELMIRFLDSEEDYLQKAYCPSDFKLDF